MEKWFRCQDLLPEAEADVLAYSESTGLFSVASLSPEGDHWLSDCDFVDGSVRCDVVSHWTHLPPPPA